ncbi:hypothetical protein SAMN05660226_03173 [Parapedobacter luteus]|uniref:Ig-like domain-containing protein n=2 Tax=Sphingobacteriaceae TaxID=84566 RepID=A0A1T5E5S3_9SPHI|nr:hypothetical protein SAMN05660226_03173 [Parapedobacter luteus]
MKTTMIKCSVIATATLVFLLNRAAVAQVTPTMPGVTLFCSGMPMTLPTPGAGQQWMVRYSATSTETPTTTLALTDGTTIPAADLQTGYYYVSTIGDTTNPEVCESEMQEIAVYVFAPLSVSFTATDYCIEDVGSQAFTGTVTSADPYDTFSYQWYTVADGGTGTETPIPGATNATYEPSADIAPGTTTTYRLRAGYLVAGLRYCSADFDATVAVTAQPGAPTITIEGAAGQTPEGPTGGDE